MKYLIALLCSFFLGACSADRDSDSAASSQLGTVQFPVSGSPEAQRRFERGIQLLHHMAYEQADGEFAAAIEADPDCAMGYWGRAMTIINPLWPNIPSESRLRAGWELIETARALASRTGTERERAYIETLAVYFENAWEREERDRLFALDKAWDKLRKEHPDDLEAACFFALFHLAPARFLPKDESYRLQTTSGLIVEDVLKRIPDHPGAHHYRIHAYDFPALAGRALDLCGLYGEIAPDDPHALHMPTHIYTRGGLWEKSIELNLRSAAAALKEHKGTAGVARGYLHALDYAVYAYLQRGEYAEAEKIRDKAFTLEGPHPAGNMNSGSFAFSAIPVRCALESQQWEEAARIEPGQPSWFPWDDRFIAEQSMVYFARAIGAVRSGDLDTARKEVEDHKEAADQVAVQFPATYWDAMAKSQQLAVLAWLAFAEDREVEALSMMREAAKVEASTEKEAVTPGEVLPTGELLGDMLTEMGRYEEAIAAYQAVLERSPNRFYSLYGIGYAAESAGDEANAKRYYQLLIELGKDADPGQPRLERAKSFLASL